MMSILRRYEVTLLDMNSTFMFGEDRFGPNEDFSATYRALGGTSLNSGEIANAIRATYAIMAADYENPDKYDNFPKVRDVIRLVAPSLPERELALLDQVFAQHERGVVSQEYAAILHKLSGTHRLGLVANIWCKKQPWLDELRRAGVLDLFQSLVFSSDYNSIKPSQVLFGVAVNSLKADRQRVVFISDSLRCDIEGAKKAGLSTIWINAARTSHSAADFVVGSLLELDLLQE